MFCRLCFAASREGQMLEVFSYISVKRLTPAPAVLFQGMLALVFSLACENIITLIEFTSFLVWIFYGLSMVALLVMRYTKKDVKRPFRVSAILNNIKLSSRPIIIFTVMTPILLCPPPTGADRHPDIRARHVRHVVPDANSHEPQAAIPHRTCVHLVSRRDLRPVRVPEETIFDSRYVSVAPKLKANSIAAVRRVL